jgi:RNA polymerase sigma factor (sigma-70 family)
MNLARSADIVRLSRKGLGTNVTPESQRMTGLLIELARERDQAVFAELFQFYAPRIKAYLRRLGADERIAEELAQDALATVWNKVTLFDASKSGAGTWIFTIARNLRVDALRRERRPEVDPTDPGFEQVEDETPERVLSERQRARAVNLALGDLPAEQARIVRLSFFEDRPHGEIAEELGIPLGTVKSRLRLAMQRFRKALGEFQ